VRGDYNLPFLPNDSSVFMVFLIYATIHESCSYIIVFLTKTIDDLPESKNVFVLEIKT